MSTRRILIIDDDAAIRRLVKATLESTKEYEVHEASDGDSGLELARALKPDLILLDLKMPQMDGPTFLDEIRKNKDLAGVQVIVITGLMTPDAVARQGGFVNEIRVLAKPISPGQLLACIRNALA